MLNTNLLLTALPIARRDRYRSLQMRLATQTPSAWLRLLCRDWCLENEARVAGVDAAFLRWKSYLRGQLTSQLLCRLSIGGAAGLAVPPRDPAAAALASPATTALDFWKTLGVDDEFDRAHIVANIERFCSLYNIRGGTLDEPAPCLGPHEPHAAAAIFTGNHLYDAIAHPMENAAAAALSGLPTAQVLYPLEATEAYAVAAMADPPPPLPPPAGAVAAKARPPVSIKSQERHRKATARERERRAYAARKIAEKAARRAAREELARHKLALRRGREASARREQEAALRRAAELVASNRVPLEITRPRGGAAATASARAPAAQATVLAAVAHAAQVAVPPAAPPGAPLPKRGRSSIVISTASDLDQIVTHSNNLWAKYNAIAKEHNRKVNWIVVAKELGIHVKVREKYARMHLRAKSRGFDFARWGHYRIKDYPQFFLDPLVGPASGPELADVEDTGCGGGAYQQAEQPLRRPPVPGIQLAAATDARGAAAAIRDIVMLAAEAAGVAAACANDPSMVGVAVAAAMEVQEHPPPPATTGKGVHVVPPFPQVDNMPVDDITKTVNL